MLAERIEEWKKNYREEGLQEGRQEGMHKGALQLLIRQLEKKFGKLPADIVAQLDCADEKQIIFWSERILTADSLSDIFGH